MIWVSYWVIGKNIKRARKEAKLSQQMLAERIGMSTVHFGRIERGERETSLEVLARIANCVNVPISTLLHGSMPEEECCALPVQSGFAARIGEISEGCSEEAKELMLRICREIANAEKQGRRKQA